MSGYLIGGRFLTGEITLRKILPISCSIELTLNGAESVKADLKLPLIDPRTGVGIDIPNQIVPQRDFLGWVENGIALAAGPVQGDPFAFPRSSTVNAAGAWEYFTHRLILPPGTVKPSEVTSAWSGLSLRTMPKRIVQQACSWPHAGLPIDYEPDVSGTAQREYPGGDRMWVADALKNLTEVENGPDITFRPKIMPDQRHVRWDLLTGDPDLTQAGADHYWDLSAPGRFGQVTGLDRDGRDLATHAWGVGATDETTSVVLEAAASSTALTDAGFPMLEMVEQRNSVKLAATLQAYVDEDVVRYSAFTETFTLQVRRDKPPLLGTYWPGDWARIRLGRNPRIPQGTYRVRIIRIRFDATGDVTLECAPERVVGGYPVPSSNRAWLGDKLRGLQSRIEETQRG